MLELKHITKTFKTEAGDVTAVDDVSLSIRPGEIFGIIGFSGAGKSTLVRCINLLERPTSGEVVVDGTDLTKLSDAELRVVRRRIGMIFQHFNLMPSRTVFDNIALALRHSGLDKEAKARKIKELLALVGLSEKIDAYPAQPLGDTARQWRGRVGHPRDNLLDPPAAGVRVCDYFFYFFLGGHLLAFAKQMATKRALCSSVLRSSPNHCRYSCSSIITGTARNPALFSAATVASTTEQCC